MTTATPKAGNVSTGARATGRRRRVPPHIARRQSLACIECLSATSYLSGDAVMTTGDILPVVQSPSLMTSLTMLRSTSPKAVVSESSPIKKRRVDGFYGIDYTHRRASSRSGDLALLRVLSAPPSPLSVSPPTLQRPQVSPLRQRIRADQKFYLLERPSASASVTTTTTATTIVPSAKSLEIRKDQFVFPQQPARPPRRSLVSRADVQTIPAKAMEQAATMPEAEEASSADAIKQAEEVAGPTAVHFKQLIPPRDEDAITEFFNPESPHLADGTERSIQSQLAAPVGPNAPLRERIEALSKGGSLLVVYPTQGGAKMFVEGILLPVLDPLIRRTVNDHGLPDEVAKEIRSTCSESVSCLMDYAELEETCREIVQSANEGVEDSPFKVQLAKKAVAKVPASAWKNAWIAEEREMIRTAVDHGLRRRGGGASIDYSGIAHPKAGVRVAEDLLNDLKNHRFEDWERQEKDEIEVGVFVINRQ